MRDDLPQEEGGDSRAQQGDHRTGQQPGVGAFNVVRVFHGVDDIVVIGVGNHSQTVSRGPFPDRFRLSKHFP